MEFVLELVLSVIGEVVLGTLAEVLTEIGLTALFDGDRVHPLIALIGYPSLGGGLGFGSAWLLPELLLDTTATRAAYLVVVPIAAGLMMALIGGLRRRRGQTPIRLDSFLYGWLFAVAFCGARWLGAVW